MARKSDDIVRGTQTRVQSIIASDPFKKLLFQFRTANHLQIIRAYEVYMLQGIYSF